MSNLPRGFCLIAGVATPLTADLEPDDVSLLALYLSLFEKGCDGTALFGIIGGGSVFSVERQATLVALFSDGFPHEHPIVFASAMGVADTLTRQAVAHSVMAVLVIRPFLWRSAVSGQNVQLLYSELIDRFGNSDFRFFLNHQINAIRFAISLVVSLFDRFEPIVADIGNNDGDLEFTFSFTRQSSELFVTTVTESHLPALLLVGGSGGIGGLGNIMTPVTHRVTVGGIATVPATSAIREIDDLLAANVFVPRCKVNLAQMTAKSVGRAIMPLLNCTLDGDSKTRMKAFDDIVARIDELYPMPVSEIPDLHTR